MADKLEAFKVDLAALINNHSLENRSDTPDFILADHLVQCLITFENSVNARSGWHNQSKTDKPED